MKKDAKTATTKVFLDQLKAIGEHVAIVAISQDPLWLGVVT